MQKKLLVIAIAAAFALQACAQIPPANTTAPTNTPVIVSGLPIKVSGQSLVSPGTGEGLMAYTPSSNGGR